jgi:DNA-binding MarR family transcriptional regulator
MLSTANRYDPEVLAEKLHSAAVRLLRSVRHVDLSSSLNSARLSALSVIVFAGPITLGDLANAEQVKPPTMTRIVHALEKQRLVNKRLDATDRRSILLSATTKGKRLLIHARWRRTEILTQKIEQLSARERSALKGGLDVFTKLSGN